MNLKLIKSLIRGGNLEEAQGALQELAPRRIRRKARLELAFAAREARLPHLAATLLQPVVRPAVPTGEARASPEELIEYAFALIGIGCPDEARTLLKGLNFARFPGAGMAEINACFREWRWTEALPHIRRILERALLRRREALALRLDHAIAMLYGQAAPAECRRLLEELISELQDKDFSPLRFDAFLMLAVSYYLTASWPECERALAKAERVFGKRASPYLLAVTGMWRALLELNLRIESGDPINAQVQKLDRLKEYFIRIGRASFARQCDYYCGAALRDEARLLRLYFLSPLPGVRRRVYALLQTLSMSVPSSFTLDLGSPSRRFAGVLDLAASTQWKTSGAKPLQLKAGHLQHRLLAALARDSYERPGLPRLFELAFPGEHYLRPSSARRIADGLFRLRQSLRESRVPLSIRESEGRYWLKATGPVKIRFRVMESIEEDSTFEFLKLRIQEKFGKASFSSSQFAEAFNLSDRTARFQLKKACENKWLARSGRGPATLYSIRQ